MVDTVFNKLLHNLNRSEMIPIVVRGTDVDGCGVQSYAFHAGKWRWEECRALMFECR